VPTRDAQTEAFLDRWPDLKPIALKARELIFDVMPEAVEQVKPGWSVIWYGPGSRMKDTAIVIQPQRAWVNLGLANGATLPDPAGLLEGTGKGTGTSSCGRRRRSTIPPCGPWWRPRSAPPLRAAAREAGRIFGGHAPHLQRRLLRYSLAQLWLRSTALLGGSLHPGHLATESLGDLPRHSS